MLISHKHKFIFIHIPKTAGTSISSVLNPFCEELYPSIKHSNAVKIKEKFGSDIWNEYFKFTFIRNPYERLLSWYNMIEKNMWRPNLFQSHIKKNIHSFSEFIMDDKHPIGINKLPQQRISQFKIISENGRVIVDFVGRYENLNEDFNYICNKLNIPQTHLPHINKFDHDHYMNYYTKEMISEVNSFAEADFIHFYNKQNMTQKC
jgi:chondroitin 4-sulfotransferase 11